MANLIFGTTGVDTDASLLTYRSTADLNDMIFAGNGADIFTGGMGNDLLYGEAGADSIGGGVGDDVLDGGSTTDASAAETTGDTMFGGLGNDIYFVSSTFDVVDEATTGTTDDGGTDTVVWSSTSNASLTTSTDLGKVENLILTEAASTASVTGNTLNNRLIGNSAINTLTGDIGDDYLDGRGGVDIMAGGLGNDTYVVNTTDTVTETSTGGTADTINVALDSVGTYTIAVTAIVEKATVSNTLASSINASALTTAITLTGNTAANTLTTGSGADILIGGGGTDALIGGTGNDTYTVDSTDDTITESSGAGTDIVNVAMTTAGTYTLSANIETAKIISTAAVNITASTTAVALTGNTAVNTLTGNIGNDTLDGGPGVDVLLGGKGDDVYIVESVGETITENSGEGTDTVKIAIASSGYTYVMTSAGSGSDNIEYATITSTAALNVTGNAIDNILTGNSANNKLDGGAGTNALIGGVGADTLVGGNGNDALIGGAGSDTLTSGSATDVDTFVYTTAADSNSATSASLDTITDLVLNGAAGDLFEFNLKGVLTTDSVTITATAVNFDTTSEINALLNSTTGTASTKFSGGGNAKALLVTTADGTPVKELVVDVDGSGTFTAADVAVIVTNVTTTSFTTKCFVTAGTLNGTSGVDSLNGSTGIDTINADAGADIVKGGMGADTITGGAGADVIDGGLSADVIKWAATTAALFATETGSAAGTNNNFNAGTLGDKVVDFTTGSDKLYFAAAGITNATGTETDTLLSIATTGTVTNVARFVEITSVLSDGNMDTAVTALNGLTTSAVAIADSFIAFVHDTTNGYLYYVKQVSVADTIAAQDVTLIGQVTGVTDVANGDFVSF